MLSHAGTQACNSDSESDQAQFAALLAATHRPPNTLNKIVMGSSVVSRLNLSSAMALCQPKPQTDIGFHRDGLCHSHSDSKIRP